MIAPLLASLLLVAQTRAPLDSGTVTRVLDQLRTSDSMVCALAGQALTNYGGFGGWNHSDPGMPMPQPMPTPMPMPGGGIGDFHINMHEWGGRKMDPAVLRAFRAFIRDDNRCVRNIAARVIGNHGGRSESYELFLGMLRDARADFRETGALGLGEVEDSRAINPLSNALSNDDSPAVRMTARAASSTSPTPDPVPANNSSSTSTTVTLSWYNFLGGALAYTQTVTLTAGTGTRIDPWSITQLAADKQYSVVVDGGTGTVTAIVTEFASGGDNAMIYEGFAAP